MPRDFEIWDAMDECEYYNYYEVNSRACKHKKNRRGKCSEETCPLDDDDEE